MIYLLTGIVTSTCIFVIFRLMQDNGAHTRHAIIINYLVAAIVGVVLFQPSVDIFIAPWFLPTAVEGVFFYVVMCVIARTSQISGVTITSVASKMSVIIPVATGIILLQESITFLKLAGISTGLISVIMSARGGEDIRSWKWPILVFLGAGTVDATLKLFQEWMVSESEFPAFMTTIYGFALLSACIHHLKFDEKRIGRASIVSGIYLGIANFATVFCILNVLALPQWESSVVFPLNNMGVVALSTLVGVVIFKERLTAIGKIGLGLALASIVLLYLGS